MTGSPNWFARQRQDWIMETVRVFGFINREHIERKFGVSKPQASMDINTFMRINSGKIIYNKSTKRYVLTPWQRRGENGNTKRRGG